MKKMKLSLLAIVLMVATAANAQFSWGVQGGANLSNIYRTSTHIGVDPDLNPKFGFNVGVFTDFGFRHNMGIRSGLHFTTKGTRFNLDSYTYSNPELGIEIEFEGGRVVTNMMYLQVPIHFAYWINVTPGMRIMFHGGPYIAYGIGGSSRLNGEDMLDGGRLFGSADYQTNPFDWGLGIGVGAEFDRILVGIGWDMGFAPLHTRVRDGRTYSANENRNAFLTVGFRF